MVPDVRTADAQTLHLPLNTLGLRRAGLVTAVLRRANLLAATERFAAVWIEVLGLQPQLDQEAAALRESGHLHPAVRVRSVLRSLDPAEVHAPRGAGRPTRGTDVVAAGALTPALGLPSLDPSAPPVTPTVGEITLRLAHGDLDETWDPRQLVAGLLPDAGELVGVTDRLDPSASLWLHEGLPVARVVRAGTTSGGPRLVELLDRAGAVVRTARFDARGRLVHLEDRVLRDDGVDRTHRLVGSDGSTFLTFRQRADGSWHEPILRAPDGTLHPLPGMGELYRLAFERLLARDDRPVLFSEFRENLPNLPDRTLDEVVAAVRHPHLRTVAVAHSNHRRAPFTPEAGATPNWHRLLRGLDRWDRLVVLTRAQRHDVLAEFATARPEQVVVIPHPAPQSAGRPSDSYDPDRIALVARVHRKKRVDEAVRAMRHVVDARPTARLDVYGFGYGDDYERDVHELVRSLSLGDHVTFHGFVPMAAGTTPYDGACVTWLTSASEGFGLSLLESMARGVPVVSFDTPYGPSDLVDDGENGFLVPVGDVQGLAARTLQVMDDGQLRQRLALGAARAAGRRDQAAFVESWCDALRSLDGSPPVRATLAPPFEVESAEWAGDRLRLGVGVPRDALTGQLVVRVRGSREARLLPVRHGWVEVDLPALASGSIVDFSLHAEVVDWDVRDASLTRVEERRLVLPDIPLPAHPRWRLYRTTHGSFSAKALATRPSRPASAPPVVSLPHRVARALTRRH
jgi:poly(glycerol-phosphate) alpha-glucosyltransferase